MDPVSRSFDEWVSYFEREQGMEPSDARFHASLEMGLTDGCLDPHDPDA